MLDLCFVKQFYLLKNLEKHNIWCIIQLYLLYVVSSKQCENSGLYQIKSNILIKKSIVLIITMNMSINIDINPMLTTIY